MPGHRQSELADNPMFWQVCGLPDQLRHALDCLIFNVRETRKAAICGMGTCATAGRIISEYMDEAGGRQVQVLKGIDMPAWVDKDTTVIVISYSGNTQETLHSYRSAMRKGAQVVCITAGGRLAEMANQDGCTVISVPGGYESRGALGFMVGFTFKVLMAAGFIPSDEDLSSVIPSLRQHLLQYTETDDNEARKIAELCGDKAVVVYSFFNMLSASLRWKSQINENSRVLAFCGTMPEFNHNELVGWTADEKMSGDFFPIVLLDDGASKMLRCMAETPVDMLKDSGVDVYVHHISGGSVLEKTLKAVITGDIVSLYLQGMVRDSHRYATSVDDIKGIMERGRSPRRR